VITDAEILRRSLQQPAAFAELFERYARDVGRFAARAVGSDAAEDVLSETFLVAYRRRGSYDHGVGSARPWLFGIAAKLIQKHRAEQAAHWRSYAAAVGAHEESDDGAIHAAGDRADAGAMLRALAPAIGQLAARDRETLMLYAWGDLTYDEIGRALGVPIGTVRSRLNRVRRRLTNAVPGMRSDEEGELDESLGFRTSNR
jgi:RNA polymerase sigma factor (sigma-70 family)